MNLNSRIEWLNVGLLVLSLLLAFILPFHLFLFSYVVLGPMHYLTELNWLHKKSFFVSGWAEKVPFVLITLAICFPPLLSIIGSNSLTKFFELPANFLSKYRYLLFLWGLVLAGGYLGLPNGKIKENWVSISLLFVFILYQLVSFGINKWCVFIPTLIHVYLFTFLFMIYGQLKSKVRTGWLSIGLMAVTPLIIFLLPDDSINRLPNIPKLLAKVGLDGLAPSVFSVVRGEQHIDVKNPLFIKIQVFIAFAYTYHYLNWFSKTNIIGWGRQLNLLNIVAILACWVIAVGAYIWTSTIGLAFLFFLSTLHVVMEFPLNTLTIRELFGRLKTTFQKF